MASDVVARLQVGDAYREPGRLVVLDSASLRPAITRSGASGTTATITTYQGGRYHPETIRALAIDSAVMAAAATSIVDAGSHTRLIVDFQNATPGDIRAMVDAVRAIRDADTRVGTRFLAMVLPAGDTAAYPTIPLSRVANVLLIRAHGEHRPGTAPGPLATPGFITRAIGARARVIGASRLGAELPLFGYVWNRNGTAEMITYIDAQARVRAESGVFTRDPESRFLTARGRDGWTIWVPDAETVHAMASAARQRGITYITLSGPEGADPAIFTPERQTMIRSF